jgi:hypothetical protein
MTDPETKSQAQEQMPGKSPDDGARTQDQEREQVVSDAKPQESAATEAKPNARIPRAAITKREILELPHSHCGCGRWNIGRLH